MTITVRKYWPTDPSPPLEDGFYLFGNGKRRRARWTGDKIMVEQIPTVPTDRETAIEAERINALHRDTLHG